MILHFAINPLQSDLDVSLLLNTLFLFLLFIQHFAFLNLILLFVFLLLFLLTQHLPVHVSCLFFLHHNFEQYHRFQRVYRFVFVRMEHPKIRQHHFHRFVIILYHQNRYFNAQRVVILMVQFVEAFIYGGQSFCQFVLPSVDNSLVLVIFGVQFVN